MTIIAQKYAKTSYFGMRIAIDCEKVTIFASNLYYINNEYIRDNNKSETEIRLF